MNNDYDANRGEVEIFGGIMIAVRMVKLSLIAGIIVFVGACSDTKDKRVAQEPVHGAKPQPVNSALIDVIKSSKLVSYQSTTIGNALDSYKYVKNKEWTVEVLMDQKFAIIYSGWIESGLLDDKAVRGGVTARGIEARFIMEASGSFYLQVISVIETRSDGKVYRPQTLDMGSTLAKIYANEKIELDQ